jgi:hypothetical protein
VQPRPFDGTGMKRHAFAVLSSTVVLVAAAATGVSARSLHAQSATYRGHTISLREVANYHCHTGRKNVISCFDTESDKDRSLDQLTAGSASLASATSSTQYVTFYADINFGGASFTAVDPIADLGSIGWNDRISSFKSLNSGHPMWWKDAHFGNQNWQWVAGSWVGNVGADANDQFSSVEDL